MVHSVSGSHIRRGEPRSCGKCPIALAVAEHLDPSWTVEVAPTVIFFRRKEPGQYAHIRVRAPESVRTFIQHYDTGMAVVPFEFELPEPWRILH